MKKSIILLLSIICFSQNNTQEHVLFTIRTEIRCDNFTEKIKELKDEFIDQLNATQDETFKKANELKDDSLQQIDQTLKNRIVTPAIGIAATACVAVITTGIIYVIKSNK